MTTTPMTIAAGTEMTLDRWAVDELLESYVVWREECNAVGVAYQHWNGSETRAERWLAHAGYVAALDREELAARTYANQVKRFSRIARPSGVC
jgi:hypothetical protein